MYLRQVGNRQFPVVPNIMAIEYLPGRRPDIDAAGTQAVRCPALPHRVQISVLLI